MAEIIVRIAAPADAPVLARLNFLFNGVNQPVKTMTACLAAHGFPETAWLAEMDGQAVGFAALRLSPCLFYTTVHAELTELYVEPAYRRQGVARALIQAVEALAVAQGASEINLLTGFKNPGAHTFYLKMGYEMAELAMRKSLPAPVDFPSEES